MNSVGLVGSFYLSFHRLPCWATLEGFAETLMQLLIGRKVRLSHETVPLVNYTTDRFGLLKITTGSTVDFVLPIYLKHKIGHLKDFLP